MSTIRERTDERAVHAELRPLGWLPSADDQILCDRDHDRLLYYKVVDAREPQYVTCRVCLEWLHS